ncbi:putative cytochrome-c oxidase chain V precursor [Acaromyces ingoldii]|uniref:Putative cytochrome-c oxidase chain V n=1 Tax=Acaromyces ingoldii TaxID=215250 RepID=A0A316YF56_9BASI|nr:putative cytochrome-c oxidase chain V precursor [Acaromyces ingoldii]PWN87741.1 putative cytochrome-c oxidase chain V precursor [Acaromyces ingoldii]
MLAPIRSAARPMTRASQVSGALSSAARCRTMVTKEERWTPATARSAAQSNLIPDASGKGGVDLSTVVPNIEARWAQLSKEEQYGIFRQLEEVQRRDWKELSVDEKKAAYFVSFGPHGPRKAITRPGQGVRTFTGVAAILVATVGVFYGLRHFAHSPPKSMTKEYQDQMTQKAKDENLNPITGISSDKYEGKGYEQKVLG